MELIGSGGMGSVYRAERADKAYTKPVAIKLLSINASDLRKRFALEQRILGALTHPNIAALLDVGTDAGGVPYLVMEYVDGQPITEYARIASLGLKARADLFLKILDAVQTAHSQLIVHRDLKPGNVLVDAHGEPKLLDFGIAKLLGDDVPSATRTGLGPLTPNYASPEQVRAEPIGTGSDIYSLGVVLYELMTGELPYRIVDSRPSAIERMVCESDPQRPSAHLGGRVGGASIRDLDAIILRALEKSPRQRYASCAAFADDLRHWRDGEQVQARQPAVTERALRYLRRHRVAVSVTGGMSLALLIGSAAALWQAHAADLARRRAEQANRFLTDMLSAANPGDLGRNATVVQVLDRARRLADRSLASDPQTAATAQMTLVKTYGALGDWQTAHTCAEAALKAARQVGDTAVLIDAEIALGEILDDTGNVDDAQKMEMRGRLDAVESGTARQRATAAEILGRIADRKNDRQGTRRWYATALTEVPADDPDSHSLILNELAYVERLQGDSAGSLALLRKSVGLMRQTYPQRHPALALALQALGAGYSSAGKLQAASATYAEALSMQLDLLGDNHPDVVTTLSAISALDLKKKDVQGAVAMGLRAATAAQRLPTAAQAFAARGYMAYGNALVEANQAQDAKPQLEHALAIYRKFLSADHPLVANAESAIGLVQAQLGEIAGGANLTRSAYARLLEKAGDKNELTIAARARLDQVEAMSAVSTASKP